MNLAQPMPHLVPRRRWRRLRRRITILQSCSQPEHYVANAQDCNDNNEDINPDEIELCTAETTIAILRPTKQKLGRAFSVSRFRFMTVLAQGWIVDPAHLLMAMLKMQTIVRTTMLYFSFADEICDETDNNCDDLIDEDATDHFVVSRSRWRRF